MNKLHKQPLFISLGIFVLFCASAMGASDNTNPDVSELNTLTSYPRIEHYDHGSVQVDFPTLESWPDFRLLRAWLPVEVVLKSDNEPRVGSAYVQAGTVIDFEERTVHISNQKVLKTRFPENDESGELNRLTSRAFNGRESVVPLDILLRLLPEDFEIPDHGSSPAQLNFDPPVIVVSESPVKLLSVDKKPIRAPIEGTELEYVVNTNWNVFYHLQRGQWFVLNDGVWQKNNFLADGDWTSVEDLPADFDRLALSEDWPEVREAMSASEPTGAPVPFMISLEETELILIDGEPRTTVIGTSGISYVNNSQSDLFRFGEHWYFLVSGRWFSNRALSGEWQPVKRLPDAFSKIPSDHAKGHVLYSVPGTRQARLALIEAALPHRNQVARGSGEALEVKWVGEPQFEAIETTTLQRGLNTPFQIIKHNNYYYLCFEGAWYFSTSPMGQWKVATLVPDEIYRIPATDPAYNVTFVRLDTQQEDTGAYVNYSYSSGYTGSFSTSISVVYGTGWYYPSNVYWDSVHSPVYWHYGRTYGYNTGYHPVGAFYGARHRYYNWWGPRGYWGGYGYGGWGGYSSITITSPSVNFTQGYGSAWEGPLQTTPGDPAQASENTLDEFLPKKQSDGTEQFVKASEAGIPQTKKISVSSLYMDTTLSSVRFSGPDGEVYRKNEGQQWSQYSDGNWETMQSIERTQPVERRPQQRPEKQNINTWIPAHKRTLSRSELDRQELARLEGMDNYSKYRMQKESEGQ